MGDVGAGTAPEPARSLVVADEDPRMVLAVAVLDPDGLALLEAMDDLLAHGDERIRTRPAPTPGRHRWAGPGRARFAWKAGLLRGLLQGLCHLGVYGVRRGLTEWLDVWDAWEAGVDNVFAAPDGRVVVLTWQRGKGRQSGLPINMEWRAQVITLRDGRIARVDAYDDRAEALEAADSPPGAGLVDTGLR